jgi:hypothetical protein
MHKFHLERQETIVVRFGAPEQELVLVPVKVKTGKHREVELHVGRSPS